MHFRRLHSWNLSLKKAVAIQRRLAQKILHTGRLGRFRFVAGADAAFSPDGSECIAGVVIWDCRSDSVSEQVVVRRPVTFPYIPGLLSFREAPSLLAAFRRLRTTPDVFLFDAQGIAHPRRFGLASHVGLWLDRPAIGCAKSLLIGRFDPPPPIAGSKSPLFDGNERVGSVLRTRTGVRPLFISIGHRVSLPQAVRAVLACCTRYRLPEPTRLADKLVTQHRNPTFPPV